MPLNWQAGQPSSPCLPGVYAGETRLCASVARFRSRPEALGAHGLLVAASFAVSQATRDHRSPRARERLVLVAGIDGTDCRLGRDGLEAALLERVVEGA